MQETFLRAYRKLHQLKHPDGLRFWLYAIARRVCSEQRRSAERRNRHEALATENQFSPQNLSECYDAVIYIEETSRARPIARGD